MDLLDLLYHFIWNRSSLQNVNDVRQRMIGLKLKGAAG
jgi:hypothetical protein